MPDEASGRAAEPGLTLHSDVVIVPFTTLLQQEEKHSTKTMNQDHSEPIQRYRPSSPNSCRRSLRTSGAAATNWTAQGSWHSAAKTAASAKGEIKPTQGFGFPLQTSGVQEITKRSESTSEEALEEVLGMGIS